jgi:hypothetical protein
MDCSTYLAKPIHPSMITYPNCALLLEVACRLCTVRVVHNHRWLTTLNDVYGYCVRAAKCEDLGLTAPHGGLANARAIARILLWANDPRVPGAGAVLAFDTGEERHKVLGVR